MKGSECKFLKFMEGSGKRFVIPVYQRNYDWKTEQCKQLFDDLMKIIRNNRRSHFFGSVVSVYNPDGRNDEFLIIDGQQRLTTVSLVLLAIYNLLDEEILASESPYLKQRILEEYLVDKWAKQETRIKLKPVKNDRDAFGKLFESADEHIRESNLTTNYDYFYERIQKREISVDELFDAVCRLEIISITLNNEDNPQLIFESLNSTGLDLSEGDKIRNYILMGLPTKLQDEYYEKYWNRIEKCTHYDVSSFIRDYLSIKQSAISPQKKIYINFKDYVESIGEDTQNLLEELLDYAKSYQILLGGGTEDKALNACIYRLNRLETTVTRPFFLEVFRLYNEQKLNLSQVREIFLITESYLFRRTICDLPSNALNKIFLLLNKEIIRLDGTDADYVEKLKYILLSKKERSRFPDDYEFSLNLTERPVYLMNSKNKLYILERFENWGTLEDKDVYGHCDDGVYSIEHIMPQHLTPSWINELGENWEEIHETWLHRIANLTLTAYNSRYSNNSFEEKKTMRNGFKESGIRMNIYIAEKEKWTLSELEERNEYLKSRSLEIWQLPQTQYQPKEKQFDTCTLSDEFSLRGRIINRFAYKNTEQPVGSWTEMFQKVVRILYSEDRGIITRLAVSSEGKLSSSFDTSEDKFINAAEIVDGVYVSVNSNTDQKLNLLRNLFELYHIDPEDLIFYLDDESKKSDGNDGITAENCFKYWTNALELIKQANIDAGLFSKTNPVKRGYVAGYFGIGGFEITCVARRGNASVQFYLGKSDREANKKAFDKLYSNKDAIESALGEQLEWNRGDDIVASYISYRLNNVDVNDESDWKLMAEFHAEQSKKFYDVFVPYLK